jgi:hypothetical protein
MVQAGSQGGQCRVESFEQLGQARRGAGGKEVRADRWRAEGSARRQGCRHEPSDP